MNTQTAQSSTVQTSTKPDFGKGRYSGIMASCFDDAITVLHIDAAKAEKIARDLGSDVGTILSHVPADIRVSKVSKDGKVSLSDVSKIKGITVTNPIAFARALQWIGEAGKNGVSYGFTQWKLAPALQEYVDGLTVK